MAQQFLQQERRQVRLPVFSFEDWCQIYHRQADGASLSEHRLQTRRNWYLMRFLRDQGVEVIPVPIRAQEFFAWAQGGGHDLEDGHELAHAVGEYANRPETPVALCRHEDMSARRGEVLATLTIFGETPEEPEVMSAAVHTDDGVVLATLEVLAAGHSPEQAWQKVSTFLDLHRPRSVFHDQVVRRPEFCSDCNALLVNLASQEDIARTRQDA